MLRKTLYFPSACEGLDQPAAIVTAATANAALRRVVLTFSIDPLPSSYCNFVSLIKQAAIRKTSARARYSTYDLINWLSGANETTPNQGTAGRRLPRPHPPAAPTIGQRRSQPQNSHCSRHLPSTRGWCGYR